MNFKSSEKFNNTIAKMIENLKMLVIAHAFG